MSYDHDEFLTILCPHDQLCNLLYFHKYTEINKC